MADLISEKEYKEMVDSGLKTWKYLKQLNGKELEDISIIKQLLEEANEKNIELNSDNLDSSNEINKHSKPINNLINKSNINEENKYEENNENINSIKDTNSSIKENNKNHEITNEELENEEVNKEPVKLNFFESKSIELESSPQDKESFKREFLNYCKNDMNPHEMKILVGILNSKNSKLNDEFRELIENGLTLAMDNNRAYEFLENKYDVIIRTNLGKPIATLDVKEFVDMMKNPENDMERNLKNDASKYLAKEMKKINSNRIPKETLSRLDVLINPSKEIGRGFFRNRY